MSTQQCLQIGNIRLSEFMFIEQTMKEIHGHAILFIKHGKGLKILPPVEECPGCDILEACFAQIRVKIQLENNVLLSLEKIKLLVVRLVFAGEKGVGVQLLFQRCDDGLYRRHLLGGNQKVQVAGNDVRKVLIIPEDGVVDFILFKRVYYGFIEKHCLWMVNVLVVICWRHALKSIKG